eukprot:392369-Pyramimonas_sp.AAC.1
MLARTYHACAMPRTSDAYGRSCNTSHENVRAVRSCGARTRIPAWYTRMVYAHLRRAQGAIVPDTDMWCPEAFRGELNSPVVKWHLEG